MKLGRQKAEGGRPKRLRHVAGVGIRILCGSSLIACAQSTNDIPPLRPPHAEIPPTFWEQHTTSVGLVSFALFALIGVAIWWATRPKPPVIIPPEVQARGDLESLRKLPEDGRVLSKVSQRPGPPARLPLEIWQTPSTPSMSASLQ